jgi:hypothetical protein
MEPDLYIYIYEKKAKEIIREPVAFYMDQLKERDV